MGTRVLLSKGDAVGGNRAQPGLVLGGAQGLREVWLLHTPLHFYVVFFASKKCPEMYFYYAYI